MIVTPARAEALDVSGIDFFYSEAAGDGSVDILTVTGAMGDTVYINMKEGDATIASHLAFTLDENTATDKDNNGDMVGAVSVNFNASSFSSEKTYSIEVYSDREEKGENLLYAGTVSSLYAKVGEDKPTALAVRTIGEKDKDRPFTAPQSMQDHNGVAFALSSEETQEIDGKQCYIYNDAEEVEESAEAHVYYYDVSNAKGDPIKTETIILAQGASQDVPIESIIAGDDGNIYRTLLLADKVTVAYPGTTDYSIMCKKLTGENWGGGVKSFYKATIKYVDENGASLGVVDTVIVNKTYTYTAPTNLYVNSDGMVKEYEIADRSKAVLKLETGAAESSAEFKIAYKPVADDAERTWTVVLENGTVSPKDSKRVIKRITYTGRPGDSAVHTTQNIDVDGVTYVPTAAAENSYTHTFAVADMDVEQTIYYVPEDYVAPEPYTVTVSYVNIATNQTIATQTYTASPTMRQDLEITSPESFTQDGIEWVRLNGQDKAIRHSYYSAARGYVVYYRDINDDLHATTVIRTVRVVYVDEEGNTVTRPTTVIDNGTTTEAGAAGAAGADGTGTADGTATGLQTGEDILAVDGDGEDGDTLVSQDGTDLATMRIEDDETPLAASATDGAEKTNPMAAAIGGIGAAVAAGLILFFVYKRRKQGNDESSEDDITA